MGGAEWHFPDDKKKGKAVTDLESESVTAHEVSNKIMMDTIKDMVTMRAVWKVYMAVGGCVRRPAPVRLCVMSSALVLQDGPSSVAMTAVPVSASVPLCG